MWLLCTGAHDCTTCSHNQASVALLQGQIHQRGDGVLLSHPIGRSKVVVQERNASFLGNANAILAVHLRQAPDVVRSVPVHLCSPAGQFGDELAHKRRDFNLFDHTPARDCMLCSNKELLFNQL